MTSFEPKLSWEVVHKQFDNLIKYAAKQQALKTPNMDNMLSAEDLYQEGVLKLYDCWSIWCNNPENDKDMEEFKSIFKLSLFRQVKNKSGADRKTKVTFIDLDDMITNIEGKKEDVVQDMYVKSSLSHLKEMLENPIAVKIMEEMMEPSKETLFQVHADYKRKEMLKSQGKRVNIPTEIVVRMKHIERSLKITSKQSDEAIKEIKGLAPVALSMLN